MKTIWIAAIATVALVEVISFLETFGQRDIKSAIGISNFLFGIVAFLIGVLAFTSKQTENIGKGILLGSGIVFLIGLSLCSM